MHYFYTSAFSISCFVLSAMDGKIEQCVGKSATKTLGILREAFEQHSLSWTVVSEWHSCFKAGRVSVEDDEFSGQPSYSKKTENVKKNRELIQEDCHQMF
jgi:hypothetical protein